MTKRLVNINSRSTPTNLNNVLGGPGNQGTLANFLVVERLVNINARQTQTTEMIDSGDPGDTVKSGNSRKFFGGGPNVL